MIFCGCSWSTVQPTDWAVPSISLQVPARVLAQLRGRITRAISTMSSMEMLPVCLMFFSCGRRQEERRAEGWGRKKGTRIGGMLLTAVALVAE